MVGNEIAAIYLGRLKELGVPDERLRQVAEDICYDIAAAMNKIRDFDIPEPDPVVKIVEVAKPPPAEEKVVKKIEKPESSSPGSAILEENTGDFELPDLSANDDFFLEKTDDYNVSEESAASNDSQPTRPAEGVLSPDEILKILNAAKTAP